MTEPATASETKAASAPERPRAAWEQQPGENDLWYARFLRYVALGPRRSVSIVAKGKPNAYPIPAHWPIQAKQNTWKVRAEAFDQAAKANPGLIATFNSLLGRVMRDGEKLNGEVKLLTAAIGAGGYQAPPEDDEAKFASTDS